MNKYTALGLLAAASEGKRILVVSPFNRDVRDALDEVQRLVPSVVTVTRAPGSERIKLPTGGEIAFTTPGRLRGRSADVVLIEDDRDLGFDYVDELRAVTAASLHGELVRY